MSQVELRRRPSRTAPATVVALVLLVVTAAITVASVSRLLDGTWPTWALDPAGSVARQTWGSAVVVTTGAVLLVVGVVLLLAAARPGRRSGIPVAHAVENAEASEVVITPRGVARLAAAAADEVDGVEHVDVSASKGAVRVVVSTSLREDVDAVRAAVQQSVQSRLDVLGTGPVCPVETRVRVKES